MVTFLLAAAIGFFQLPIAWLFVVATLIGIAMAGTWSADRPFMLRLTPPDRVGEFYGLYGMVGRFSAITGPFLWGVTTRLLVDRSGLPVLTGEAVAILVLLVMMIVGYWILKPVSDRRTLDVTQRSVDAPAQLGAGALRQVLVLLLDAIELVSSSSSRSSSALLAPGTARISSSSFT